jgi:RNA polymerase sigma-70 factor (ECF subfamily)
MAIQDDIAEQVPGLRRYARALVGDCGCADDLVQDTLERSLRYATQFRRGTNPRRWLMTIMHNVFVNDLRKASRQTLPKGFNDDGIAGARYGASGNPISSLEVRDLDCALQMLPEPQREVVLMVGLEGMSYVEVSLVLSIPVGTVMSRLSRARERLRELTACVRPEPKRGVTST